MASIAAVREALAAQIQALTGLKMSARMPDQINPPQGAILPGKPYAKYGITLGEPTLTHPIGHQMPVPTDVNLVVAVFASRAPSLDRAQATVDNYLGLETSDGSVSIVTAILHDPTLGGIVEYCEPMMVDGYGTIEVAGQEYFQGRITCSISVTQDLGA